MTLGDAILYGGAATIVIVVLMAALTALVIFAGLRALRRAEKGD